MNLLFDPSGSLGAELPLSDVRSLEELEELLGFPPHVVELAELRSTEIRPAQSRDEEGLGPVES